MKGKTLLIADIAKRKGFSQIGGIFMKVQKSTIWEISLTSNIGVIRDMHGRELMTRPRIGLLARA